MASRVRKPVKAGEKIHISIVVDSEIIQAADQEAERLTEELRIPLTRTDVVRRWLSDSARDSSKKPQKGR